jgi:hypothetical protein
MKTTEQQRAKALARYYEKRNDPEFMQKRNEYQKARYRSNPKYREESRKAYHRVYKECPKYKKRVKEYGLKKRYGLTVEGYNILFTQQGNTICTTTHATKWHVDHCHTSGKVRGILCQQCNHMLGLAYDNPAVLAAAVEYLNNGE